MKWIKAFRAAFAGKKTNHTGADYKIVVAPLEGWSQASYKAVADMVDTLGGMAYQNTKASCARQPGEFLPFPASKLSCGIETKWRYNINHNQNDNFAGRPSGLSITAAAACSAGALTTTGGWTRAKTRAVRRVRNTRAPLRCMTPW